jgi:hypothetical protein
VTGQRNTITGTSTDVIPLFDSLGMYFLEFGVVVATPFHFRLCTVYKFFFEWA